MQEIQFFGLYFPPLLVAVFYGSILSLVVSTLVNLSTNGYMATPYAMQVTLTFGWGVAGGMLLGVLTALLVKPISAHRLLQRQQAAFSEELSRLDSAAPDEQRNLARSLRHRARMSTVWWRGLSMASDRQAHSQPVLDMIARLPEITPISGGSA